VLAWISRTSLRPSWSSKLLLGRGSNSLRVYPRVRGCSLTGGCADEPPTFLGAPGRNRTCGVTSIARNTTRESAPRQESNLRTRFSHHGTAGPFRIYAWVTHHDGRTEPHTEKEPAVPSVSRSKSPIHLGLDVHRDSISVAILHPNDEADVERIFHDETSVRRLVGRFSEPRDLRACYEADSLAREAAPTSTLRIACELRRRRTQRLACVVAESLPGKPRVDRPWPTSSRGAMRPGAARPRAVASTCRRSRTARGRARGHAPGTRRAPA
jgi:hypothetical protein